jgi:sorbitol-specific phosphotransferase system component IIC
MNFLKGYKTTIFAGLVVLLGILDKIQPDIVPVDPSTSYIVIGVIITLLRAVTTSPIFKAFK